MWKKPEQDEPQSLKAQSPAPPALVPASPSSGHAPSVEAHGERALIGQSLYVKGDLRGAEGSSDRRYRGGKN